MRAWSVTVASTYWTLSIYHCPSAFCVEELSVSLGFRVMADVGQCFLSAKPHTCLPYILLLTPLPHKNSYRATVPTLQRPSVKRVHQGYL